MPTPVGDTTTLDLDELNVALTAAARRVRSPRVFALLGEEARVFIQPPLIMLFAKIAETAPVRITDLARHIALDRSTVSRQVRELVDAGLVEREPDANDKRSHFVALSREGRAAQAAIVDAWRRVLYAVTEEWSPADRRRFAALLRRFDGSLERVVDEARLRAGRARTFLSDG